MCIHYPTWKTSNESNVQRPSKNARALHGRPSRSTAWPGLEQGESFFSKFNFLWDDPNHGDLAVKIRPLELVEKIYLCIYYILYIIYYTSYIIYYILYIIYYILYIIYYIIYIILYILYFIYYIIYIMYMYIIYYIWHIISHIVYYIYYIFFIL